MSRRPTVDTRQGQITVNGQVFNIEMNAYEDDSPTKLTRVYVWTDNDFDQAIHADIGFSNDDLRCTLRGDDPDMDKMWDRWNHRQVKWQRKAALQVIQVDSKDLKFSRHAGCSCPCSPGYIAQRGSLRTGLSVTVNVTAA